MKITHKATVLEAIEASHYGILWTSHGLQIVRPGILIVKAPTGCVWTMTKEFARSHYDYDPLVPQTTKQYKDLPTPMKRCAAENKNCTCSPMECFKTKDITCPQYLDYITNGPDAKNASIFGPTCICARPPDEYCTHEVACRIHNKKWGWL